MPAYIYKTVVKKVYKKKVARSGDGKVHASLKVHA